MNFPVAFRAQAFDLDPTDDAPSNPAYLAPSDLSTFLVLGQGEVGDLCAFPFAYYRDASNYLEQHLWSNAAAQAGAIVVTYFLLRGSHTASTGAVAHPSPVMIAPAVSPRDVGFVLQARFE